MPLKIINVVGARPNYMKIAPVMELMLNQPEVFKPVLVHTGQHYDYQMSHLFFHQLKMPKPDINLKVGSLSHAQQTASIMSKFEEVLLAKKPDIVVVAGDVNSTIACALVAKKMHIKVAHIEAGLRSFDMHMAEEVNRILTDKISDYLFTPSKDANINLIKEGANRDKIHFVGNVMIDTLLKFKDIARESNFLNQYGVKNKDFILLTLHRPENVDNQIILTKLVKTISKIAKDKTVLFPIHPRTKKNIEKFNLAKYIQEIKQFSKTNKFGIFALQPLGYLDFVNLMIGARFVMTDSGGIQEETLLLKVPCITLRDNTERPITVELGGNIIAGRDEARILLAVRKIEDNQIKIIKSPQFWDGSAAKRIVNILENNS